MKATFSSSLPEGTIKAPPSKSISHRALICGALSECSSIENIAFSDDISATHSCLEALGAKFCGSKTGGLILDMVPDGAELFCNESGSTLRFLLPFCMASGKKIKLYGSERLFSRPLGVYEDIAKTQNISFLKEKNSVTVCGTLEPGDFTIPGNISSQFISGLLFLLPILHKDSNIFITGNFESRSYVDMTIDTLEKFGIKIGISGNTFRIFGNQKYKNRSFAVEGDYSNAAFADAFNYIGGNVEITGLNPDSLQGDRVYKSIFEKIKNGETLFDISDCPDLAPIAFVLAAFFGKVTFTGTSRLKIKESDRALCMKQELAKCNVKTEISENSVTVFGGNVQKPTLTLEGHNDHRIVMALSVLLAITGGAIDGAQAVSKSYPEFFDSLKALKAGIELYGT